MSRIGANATSSGGRGRLGRVVRRFILFLSPRIDRPIGLLRNRLGVVGIRGDVAIGAGGATTAARGRRADGLRNQVALLKGDLPLDAPGNAPRPRVRYLLGHAMPSPLIACVFFRPRFQKGNSFVHGLLPIPEGANRNPATPSSLD